MPDARNLMAALLLSAAALGTNACVTTPTTASTAQYPHTEAGLIAADNARYKAMITRDLPALDALLGEDLTYVHSFGTKQDKAGHFGDNAAGRANYPRIEVLEQNPRVFDDFGIVQGVADFYFLNMPEPRKLNYTATYAWRDGRWQMIAFHCSQVRTPGPPPAQ